MSLGADLGVQGLEGVESRYLKDVGVEIRSEFKFVGRFQIFAEMNMPRQHG